MISSQLSAFYNSGNIPKRCLKTIISMTIRVDAFKENMVIDRHLFQIATFWNVINIFACWVVQYDNSIWIRKSSKFTIIQKRKENVATIYLSFISVIMEKYFNLCNEAMRLKYVQ